MCIFLVFCARAVTHDLGQPRSSQHLCALSTRLPCVGSAPSCTHAWLGLGLGLGLGS